MDVPDALAWKLLPDYSEDVARHLNVAYRLIARHHRSSASYVRAARLVSPMLVLNMAAPQRLRVYYLLARGNAALGAHHAALEWVEGACDIAEKLDDMSALSALLLLRASAYHTLFRYREAADDYHMSFELLRVLAMLGRFTEPLADVHLLTFEANMRFHLGEIEETEHILDEAEALVPAGATSSREALTIAWIRSLVYRWRGDPERALLPAQRAAEAYMRAGPSASAVRIQTVVAETALDLAQLARRGSTQRAMMLEVASSHLDIALGLSVEIDDVNGEVLTRLIQVRASGARGDNVGRVGLIETLAHEGQRLHDDTLLARAFTTLGDELVGRGERESGLNCYRQVFGILDGSEMPILAVWARRAYHTTREWQS